MSRLATFVKRQVSFFANDAGLRPSYNPDMPDVVRIHRGKDSHSDLFIAEWAEHRGLIQADFAKELEVDKGLVSKWFSGEVKPGPKNLRRIAALLGLEDPGPLSRHPDDDWLSDMFARHRVEAQELRDILAGRERDELRRMITVLKSAFPR